MPSRSTRRHAFAVMVPVLFLVLGAAGALGVYAAPQRTEGSLVYAAIQAAADSGDERAVALLAKLDAFAQRTGADYGAARHLSGTAKHGGRTVISNGFAPFYVNVRPTEVLSTEADVAKYRGLRHAELEAQAKSDSNRQITVSITPSGHRSVEEVIAALRANGLSSITLMVDVFENGPAGRVWKSRFTHAATDDVPDDFLAAPGELVAQGVLDLLAEAHADEADYSVGQLSLEVFLVRAVGPASGAAALIHNPAILLVDSETAVSDSYDGVAARVRVIHMPSVPDEIRWGFDR